MVKKGNVPIPNNHFRKHWNPCASQKGHVKCFFSQAAKKNQRRANRAKKARKLFPRPVKGPLRPVVRCPTQRYNMRTRAGKGFTLAELKAAGISNKNYARTIGISVDHRRQNRSEEAKAINVERLKAYMANLILFPLKKGQTKKGDASPEDVKAATQLRTTSQVAGLANPKSYGKIKNEKPRPLSADEKKRHIYQFLRKVQKDYKYVGKRIKARARRDAKAEKKRVK